MTTETLGLVKDRLKDAAQKSWELGTRMQALLELQAPSVSVFTASSIPGSPAARNSGSTGALAVNVANAAYTSRELDDILGISYQIIFDKDQDSLPLMDDGSSADPASNGVGVLVANWTGAQGADFANAAKDQLTWLLQNVPRSDKGAISHRNSEVQLWADFIYMVPPFLAYYGAVTSNHTLMAESYNQIKLYRDVLLDKTGLWQHVRLGSWEDKGLWLTGQGWAAMGMMRVAATISAAGYEAEFAKELEDLETWTAGIMDAVWPYLTKDNLFYNYVNKPDTFLDAAGTTLMAASVYRAAVLFNNSQHIALAEKVYAAIGGSDSSISPRRDVRDVHRIQLARLNHHDTHIHPRQSRGSKHITADGWLTPVVNPHLFHEEGEKSAEGQAFVVMMYAARNDWLTFASSQTSANSLPENVVEVNNGAGLSGAVNAGAGSNSTSPKPNGAERAEPGELIALMGVLGAVLAWIL